MVSDALTRHQSEEMVILLKLSLCSESTEANAKTMVLEGFNCHIDSRPVIAMGSAKKMMVGEVRETLSDTYPRCVFVHSLSTIKLA